MFNFSISGPANWYKNYPKCSGSLQSPIDYKTSDITYDQSLGAITLEDFHHAKNHTVCVLMNTGHTLELYYYGAHAYNISGFGRSRSKFKLSKVTFHWGSSNSEGSEHRVNGKAYPAEVFSISRWCFLFFGVTTIETVKFDYEQTFNQPQTPKPRGLENE